MAVVDIHPEPLKGPWTSGVVLDKHVIKSVPTGYLGNHMQFDTTRSALGELVYQFKNKSGPSDGIIDTAVAFVTGTWPDRIDCVIAAPSSITQASRSAGAIAAGIAKALGRPLIAGAIAKSKTPPMKNVPPLEREAILSNAIQPGAASVKDQRILLVDDLWQTGATMRRVAHVLSEMGASEIRALAMTRTK